MAKRWVMFEDSVTDVRIISSKDLESVGCPGEPQLKVNRGEAVEVSQKVFDYLIKNEPGFFEAEVEEESEPKGKGK